VTAGLLVLWEIVEREEPHKEESLVDLAVKIRDFGFHPTIPSVAPGYIQNLMKQCWKMFAHERPTFAEILEQLDALSPEEKIPVGFTKKSTRNLAGKKSTRWVAVKKPENSTTEQISASIALNKKASKRALKGQIEPKSATQGETGYVSITAAPETAGCVSVTPDPDNVDSVAKLNN